MFLVLIVHSMDVFPIRIFWTMEAAEQFALLLSTNELSFDDWNRVGQDAMGIDASTPMYIKVVAFGEDGGILQAPGSIRDVPASRSWAGVVPGSEETET